VTFCEKFDFICGNNVNINKNTPHKKGQLMTDGGLHCATPKLHRNLRLKFFYKLQMKSDSSEYNEERVTRNIKYSGWVKVAASRVYL
jgi:hypothetical protein